MAACFATSMTNQRSERLLSSCVVLVRSLVVYHNLLVADGPLSDICGDASTGHLSAHVHTYG